MALARGMIETFTVFLLPISSAFGWDRAQTVSVYSIGALCVGLAAPFVGRLFDHSGPRTVYAIGVILIGAGFSAAAFARELWQFQLSVGFAVGLGGACLGQVPGSLLVSRWFEARRLPTALAVVASSAGAGVLLLVPLTQILVDHAGWRGAYHILGGVMLALAVPLILAPWRRIAAGAGHIVRAARTQDADDTTQNSDWTLGSAMRHHAFWSLFCIFFFTGTGMFSISVQVVTYLVEAGFSPLVAATAWGFSGVLLRDRDADGELARRTARPPPRDPDGLRPHHRGHRDAVVAEPLSEHLAARGLPVLLRQHDGIARAAGRRRPRCRSSAAGASAPSWGRSRSAWGWARPSAHGPAA